MHIMKGSKIEYPLPKDLKLLHQKQVEAFYMRLMDNVGFAVRLPVPLRGHAIPPDEDYQKTLQIFKEVKELLQMMGIKHSSDQNALTITVLE